MRETSEARLFGILRLLDWRGHCELGDQDLMWLAKELAAALSHRGDTDLCEVCERLQPIVIKTVLGRICEDCLESLYDEAAEIREQLED